MGDISADAVEALQRDPAAGGLSPDAALGVLYLERAFSLPRDQALRQVAAAPSDAVVNGFHADPALGNAWLFLFKWSEARTCFHAPLQQLIETGLARACGADPPGVAPDPFLMQLRGRLMEVQGVVERVFVHLVCRADPQALDRSLVHARLREELENRKYLLDGFFGRPVTLAIEFRAAADGAVAAQSHQRVTHVYPLGLETSTVHHGPAGEVMRVGFARLADLHAMYRAMGQRFFEANIRSILPDDTPTNRSLVRAFEEILLEGTRDPLALAFDHNGVTLFAERAAERPGGVDLTEPRLLNGAQTVASFDRFLKAHEGDARLAERKGALAETAVLCKIITDARSEFVLRVTLNNNRQNPVKPWNLHANDLIQLELQDKFREEAGIYYERQERAFAALAAEEPGVEGEDVAPPAKAVELVKLAQTFLAADGDIERMGRLTEVFEREELYSRVFSRARLGADARRIVLCYKIQFRLARTIREILARGEKKYAFLTRGRHLVWALLCQALLNEEELDAHAAAFGTKLGVEAGFTELVARLASTRVRLLVGPLVEERHALDVAREKYGFLRTKTLHDACIERGRERFGWTRRTLE